MKQIIAIITIAIAMMAAKVSAQSTVDRMQADLSKVDGITVNRSNFGSQAPAAGSTQTLRGNQIPQARVSQMAQRFGASEAEIRNGATYVTTRPVQSASGYRIEERQMPNGQSYGVGVGSRATRTDLELARHDIEAARQVQSEKRDEQRFALEMRRQQERERYERNRELQELSREARSWENQLRRR